MQIKWTANKQRHYVILLFTWCPTLIWQYLRKINVYVQCPIYGAQKKHLLGSFMINMLNIYPFRLQDFHLNKMFSIILTTKAA